ncbi:biliverdin-producing heme oxygenase [Acinetobacter sp. S40]|uniref:biliverdin-producing heme oxygenase n=1 Tax=unclassified Acinetobacter TaxID=196816 RepID=UPI00190D7147|nr:MULTISPECIES: biliverdin-producing heme oxygenase [unclassified Acinetobacter]MBJ9984725.1 biliverdin-producing heme oxygenase [Acinetobacter sp. S40]MBK0062490.1 biliverdin-producing heme oxygenase [Acinetobacter sp. S55]MBK0066294.1 biliverdin-producing heme oxygenase [Acinetobacter sp. S54]
MMNLSKEQIINNSLSLRLKQETAAEHERMHQLMAQANVFSNKEKYAQFTLSQYYFQREIEHLFEKEGVAELIPDLDIRGRSKQALADLNDLDIQPFGQQLQSEYVQLPEALGWIYVSEGSTLGAAFLFKEAQKHLGFSETFAARNLAAYPEGRAKVWKRFVQALDETGFDQIEQDRVIQGALDAFGYFGKALVQLDELK